MDKKNVVYEIIDPPFYGLGEMLQWQADKLFANFPKHLQKRIAGEQQTTIPVAQCIQQLKPRGYMGFYPCYRIGQVCYLLDPIQPGKEIGEIQFSEHISEYIRPEGDVLGFCAASIRTNSPQQPLSLQGMQLFAEQMIVRLGREISRGLLLAQQRGKLVSLAGSEITNDQKKMIAELVTIEDRLDTELEVDAQQPFQAGVSAGIFFHHAQTATFDGQDSSAG